MSDLRPTPDGAKFTFSRVEDTVGERIFMAICTAGFSEMAMEKYWRCQRCGKETKRN